MNKKNSKFFILTYFLTSLIIYGVLIVGDYFYHLAQYSKMRPTNDILTKRKKEEDRKYLAELKSLGYKKIIFPYIYYYYPETSKKYVKDIVPINAQPNANVYYSCLRFRVSESGLLEVTFRNDPLLRKKATCGQPNTTWIG